MLKRLTAACLLSFAGLGAAAQLPDSADMSAGGEFRRRIDRHTSTKAYRMLFVGTPLIVGGVVMQAYDSDFRRLRNGYSRSFRHDYDDWLQYAPAGAMVALKACGVRGRSHGAACWSPTPFRRDSWPSGSTRSNTPAV